MMVPVLGLLLLPSLAQAAGYRIDLGARPFRVEGPAYCVLVSMERPHQASRDEVVFRQGDRFCAWRRDGLHTRAGHRVRHWPLDATDGRSSLGEPSASPSLAGARRIGDNVYLLVRWQTRPGVATERLYEVNLSEGLPRPRLLGGFEGTSTAQEAVDDRLATVGERPTWIARRADGAWGVAFWEPGLGQVAFQQLGEGLELVVPVSDRIHLFVERTSYGTRLLGRADLLLARRRDLLEARAGLAPVPGFEATLWLEGGRTLRNLASGALFALPATPTIASTAFGLLAWWPTEEPTQGLLLDPETLAVRAAWRSP